MKHLSRQLASLAGLCGASLLAGCGGGLFQSHQAAPQVYELRPPAAAPLAPRVAATLVVARPTVRPGLDSDHIAVLLPDRRLDAFAGSRWSAPVPVLVQSLLIEGLRARGGFEAVVPERGAFNGRYLLQAEVREFAAVYPGEGAAPLVRVQLHAELGRVADRRLLATLDGRGEKAAAGNRLRDVLAAFEAAYAEAADALAAGVHAAALADGSGDGAKEQPAASTRAAEAH
jgi:ABC-type uncharacterized transport system auxiliary subunit